MFWNRVVRSIAGTSSETRAFGTPSTSYPSTFATDIRTVGLGVVVSLFVLSGCGGSGGSGNSDSGSPGSNGSDVSGESGTTPDPREPGSNTTPQATLNKNLPGAIYFDAPYFYQQLHVSSGVVVSLKGEGISSWPAKDGKTFATIYEGDDYDSQYVSLFGTNGISLGGFDIPKGVFAQPKISPDGQYISIGTDDERNLRGIAVFDRKGTEVRRFEDENKDGPYFNDSEWLADGSLLLVQGNTLFQVKPPIATQPMVSLMQMGNRSPFAIELSPDGTKLAFDAFGDDGKRHVFTTNIDGTDLRQLTTSGDHDYDPTWSPDGSHIAFRHGQSWHACPALGVCYGDCPTLLAVPADGSMIHVDDDNIAEPAFRIQGINNDLVGGTCAFSPPEWRQSSPPLASSSDGTPMAGDGFNRGLNGRLFYGGLNNTPTYVDLYKGETLPIKGQSGRNPYISDDGTEIVIEQNGLASEGFENKLIIQTLDGVVKAEFEVFQESASLPKLSPDKQWIAVEWSPTEMDGVVSNTVTVFDREGNYYDQNRFRDYGDWDWLSDGRLVLEKLGGIYVTDTSLSNPTLVATLPQNVSDIEVSPDDSKVAFTISGHIWTANLDGTGLKQLTISQHSEINPTWSPDGRHIAFRHDESEVYVVPADGERIYVGEEKLIPTSAYFLQQKGDITDSTIVTIYSPMYWR